MFMSTIKTNIVDTVNQSNGDEICTRFVCGLISDLANHLENDVHKYLPEIMDCIVKVLKGEQFSTETKLFAIIAVGDVYLAVEDRFTTYLDDTMSSLIIAGNISVQVCNENDEDQKDLLAKLRQSLIDSFICIAHGMHATNTRGSKDVQRKLQGYAL